MTVNGDGSPLHGSPEAAMQLSPFKPGGSKLAKVVASRTRLFDPEGV
jgi:hypothetical protein